MKIGLDSFSYHLHFGRHGWTPGADAKDLFWFLDRAAELGFDGVQLDPMHIGSYEDDYLNAVRERLRKNSLTLELGTGGFEAGKMRNRLGVARQLGGRCLRTFIGGERDPEDVRRAKLDAAAANLREAAPFAEKLGVPIAVENHEDLLAGELRDLLDRIGNVFVGACLDTGNSVILGEDPLHCVDLLLPYARCVHLKDGNPVQDESGRIVRFAGCPLGQGILDVDETLRRIRSAWPEMMVTIEIPAAPKDSVEESLAWEDRCVRESLQWLRKRENP